MDRPSAITLTWVTLPVEHSVHLTPRSGQVEQQLQQDRASGASAHLAGLGGHQRSRQTVGEELAVFARPRLCS
jgi:hypothetical protein